MSEKLRWGLIGTGAIASAFARAVPHSERGALQAVASRDPARAETFGAAHGIPRRHGSYEALLADPAVDAVYIATPHPLHVEWTVRCAEAGKHVLCEKPMALNAAGAETALAAVRRHDVFFMEAFMYRCNPLTRRLAGLLADGAVGEIRMVRASFGFHAAWNPQSRLLNNALGGGGILDVGCYTTSMANLVAGIALGVEAAEPIEVAGAGRVGRESRVDEHAAALLRYENDLVAQVATGVQLGLDNQVAVFGAEGSLVVPNPWFATGHQGGTAAIHLHRRGRDPEEIEVTTAGWLYGIEADTVAEHLAARQAPAPAMTWAHSLANLRTLDRWRAAVGCVYDAERGAAG